MSARSSRLTRRGFLLTSAIVAASLGWTLRARLQSARVVRDYFAPNRATSAEIDQQIATAIRTFRSVQPADPTSLMHSLRTLHAIAQSPWCSYEASGELENGIQDLLSEERFRLRCNTNRFLFVDTATGWRVRRASQAPSRDDIGEFHVDQFLATCSELRLCPGTRVTFIERVELTLAGLLDSSRRHFTAAQELPWTLVGYMAYAPRTRSWVNRFGERFSLDDMIHRLLVEPAKHGACGGAHALYALAVFDRVTNDAMSVEPAILQRVHQHLQQTVVFLHTAQLASGAWTASAVTSNADDTATGVQLPTLDELVRAAGHHLEWLALLSPSYDVPEEMIDRAAAFLANALARFSARQFELDYCGCSHALRALVGLRTH